MISCGLLRVALDGDGIWGKRHAKKSFLAAVQDNIIDYIHASHLTPRVSNSKSCGRLCGQAEIVQLYFACSEGCSMF